MRLASVFLFLSAVFVTVCQAAALPEFWISPKQYSVAAGDPVAADLREGEAFEGKALGFAMAGLRRFELWSGDTRRTVEAAPGAIPAVDVTGVGPGLAILVNESVGGPVVWRNWPAFEAFVLADGFPWALEDHRDRGLPNTGFRLACSRFAKALIAVGDGVGKDRAVGLEAEIVALANPYTDDVSAGFPVKLLYQGRPSKDGRLTVHMRLPDGTIQSTILVTDLDGIARLPVVNGAEYLVSSIILRPLPGNASGTDAVWETLWSSLAFRIHD